MTAPHDCKDQICPRQWIERLISEEEIFIAEIKCFTEYFLVPLLRLLKKQIDVDEKNSIVDPMRDDLVVARTQIEELRHLLLQIAQHHTKFLSNLGGIDETAAVGIFI